MAARPSVRPGNVGPTQPIPESRLRRYHYLQDSEATKLGVCSLTGNIGSSTDGLGSGPRTSAVWAFPDNLTARRPTSEWSVIRPERLVEHRSVGSPWRLFANKGGHHAAERYLTPGISAKLVYMRGRTGFGWALAGGASLAFLLVLVSHPGFTVGAPTGMSAPSAPPASIESAPAAQLQQSRFDSNGHAVQALNFSLALVAVCARGDARQDARTAPPHYGPLHRRPPPSFF